MHPLVTTMTLALTAAACLWPVEDAPNGTGLFLVVLWMAVGALHAVLRFSSVNPSKASEAAALKLIDVAVLLIIAGHVISTAIVFRTEGDRRAALNLTFEWIALGVAWQLFRNLCSDRRGAAFVVGTITLMATGLAAFGIWQHHVFYPEQAAWYRNQRMQLDHALSPEGPGGMLPVSEIIAEFQRKGIPLEGPQRLLWENRLLSSTEPFATFSLANTLAGILATAIVLLVGQSSNTFCSRRGNRWVHAMGLLLQLGMLGYCLLLTKSRSAWLGATAGIVILAVARSRTSAASTLFRWMVVGIAISLTIAGTAAFFGVLDKEVVLESPRSLQFRLLYWTGTLQMLKNHPFAGAGPGNFRQLYLKYKPPETSEEIRDPHNLILDAWASSGLTGLLGITLFAAFLLRETMAAISSPEQISPVPHGTKTNSLRLLLIAIMTGFVIHAGWDWIQGQDFVTEQPARFLLLTGLLLPLVQIRETLVRIDRLSVLAASATMMVNLMAAGGFEMPAVMLTLLACGASSTSLKESVTAPHRFSESTTARWKAASFGFVCLCLLITTLRFGLIPVTLTERHILVGEDRLYGMHNTRAARAAFSQAAKSDPLAVLPWQRLAELATYRLVEFEQSANLKNGEQRSSPYKNENEDSTDDDPPKQLLQQATEACNMLIAADRRNCAALRQKAGVLTIGSRLLQDMRLLAEAIAGQQQVVSLYPSSVRDWEELAVLCDSATDSGHTETARRAATMALELDAINRKWGHQDRYLSATSVERLQMIEAR